jgi:hypothetical protein
VERAGTQVGEGHREGVLGRIRELYHLALVRGRLLEPSHLGQAHHRPAPVVDRKGARHAEALEPAVGRQRRHVVGYQLNHPLVVGAVVMQLPQHTRGNDSQLEVVQPPRNLQRVTAGGLRLFQLAQLRVDIRHEGTDVPAAAVVVQLLGQDRRFSQSCQHRADLDEGNEDGAQCDTDLEGLLDRRPVLGKTIESV